MKTFVTTLALGASVLFAGSAMANGVGNEPANISMWECHIGELNATGQEPAMVVGVFSYVNAEGNDYVLFFENVPSPGYSFELTTVDGMMDENFLVTMQGPADGLAAPTVVAEAEVWFEVSAETNSFSARFEKDYNYGYSFISCVREQ